VPSRAVVPKPSHKMLWYTPLLVYPYHFTVRRKLPRPAHPAHLHVQHVITQTTDTPHWQSRCPFVNSCLGFWTVSGQSSKKHLCKHAASRQQECILDGAGTSEPETPHLGRRDVIVEAQGCQNSKGAGCRRRGLERRA
jgi:hypothetical protein